MDEKDIDKLKAIVYLIVAVAVIGAFLNIPAWLTNTAIQWLVGAFVGMVCSLVAGSLVEAFTGDLLKKIALNIEISGIGFSITAFAIATLVVKIWLFGW
jgi:ABC-type uncharacterized transport system permease subunit